MGLGHRMMFQGVMPDHTFFMEDCIKAVMKLPLILPPQLKDIALIFNHFRIQVILPYFNYGTELTLSSRDKE